MSDSQTSTLVETSVNPAEVATGVSTVAPSSGGATKSLDKDTTDVATATNVEMTHRTERSQCAAKSKCSQEDGEEQVFRKVWKQFKRTKLEVTAYVQAMDADRLDPSLDPNSDAGSQSRKRKRAEEERQEAQQQKVDLLDFENLHNSPQWLLDLVTEIPIPQESNHGEGSEENATKNNKDAKDFRIRKAYGIQGRPGFIFVPNPFVSVEAEAKWAHRLAVDYPSADFSERNMTQQGMQSALDNRLRWATLGYHYDWDNRKYTEERKSPFPEDLANLSKQLIKPFGMDLVPETAIINYYRSSTTMGGHKDDAEWTDDAPVVSISFGNAGVYVLGGDDQKDAGPPPPVPLIIRNGDVVILGGPSRMNIHGVPCMLRDTMPSRLAQTLPRPVAQYLQTGRINVNVRQVNPSAKIAELALAALRRVAK